MCGPGREQRLAPVGTPRTSSSDGPGGEDEGQIVCEEEASKGEQAQADREEQKGVMEGKEKAEGGV